MNGAEILVTGGTGVLGSKVVERLRSAGIKPRVLSHSGRPGTIVGDLLTGEGLEEAVRGVDTVVHCASSPFRKARQTDVEGTQRLLDAASRAGVSHLVYISISTSASDPTRRARPDLPRQRPYRRRGEVTAESSGNHQQGKRLI